MGAKHQQIHAQPAIRNVIDAQQARINLQGKPVVLVTGGCGYIGSHTTLELLIAGWSVVVLDNLSNSNVEALYRVFYLMREYYLTINTGTTVDKFPQLHFIKADITETSQITNIFRAYNSTTPVGLEIVQIGANRQSYRNASVAFQNVRTRTDLTGTVLGAGKITHVIHFAALKSVGESAARPLDYYRTNVFGLINVLSVMDQFDVRNIVFSSSAVVYGSGNGEYISESSVSTGGGGHGVGLLTNPYGRTKWMDEEILNDWCISRRQVKAIALRYFNPTGCHPSGLIGEDPNGIPTNLMPIVLQTYQRRRSKVAVYGDDYDTKDGSGVRDFIHVVDLAKGHVAAINKLTRTSEPTGSGNLPAIVDNAENYFVYNLGTGTGYSVLEIIQAFAEETGVEIPFQQGQRRLGDLGAVTANPTKALVELGWSASHGLKEMCSDLVKWANKNPTGYERLRKLSTMAIDDQKSFINRVRKASVYRKQSMAPPTLGKQINEDILEEDDEEDAGPLATSASKPVAPNAPNDNITDLLKSLVLDDNLFGMVCTPPEETQNYFSWGPKSLEDMKPRFAGDTSYLNAELSPRGRRVSDAPEDQWINNGLREEQSPTGGRAVHC